MRACSTSLLIIWTENKVSEFLAHLPFTLTFSFCLTAEDAGVHVTDTGSNNFVSLRKLFSVSHKTILTSPWWAQYGALLPLELSFPSVTHLQHPSALVVALTFHSVLRRVAGWAVPVCVSHPLEAACPAWLHSVGPVPPEPQPEIQNFSLWPFSTSDVNKICTLIAKGKPVLHLLCISTIYEKLQITSCYLLIWWIISQSTSQSTKWLSLPKFMIGRDVSGVSSTHWSSQCLFCPKYTVHNSLK